MNSKLKKVLSVIITLIVIFGIVVSAKGLGSVKNLKKSYLRQIRIYHLTRVFVRVKAVKLRVIFVALSKPRQHVFS